MFSNVLASAQTNLPVSARALQFMTAPMRNMEANPITKKSCRNNNIIKKYFS